MILWLLLFSTFFSLRVEQLMAPDVYAISPNRQDQAPLDCLFFDENGMPTLYRVHEETGWEEGLRASVIPAQQYTIGMDYIEDVSSGETLIRYASKPPRAGEIVNPIQVRHGRDDCYLSVGSDPLRKELPENYSVLAEQGNARLVSVTDAAEIFLPDQAAQELFDMNPSMPPQTQVYSLGELEEFTDSLRLLALVFALLLAVAVLWVHSFFLLKDLKRNRTALIFNGSLAAVFLIAVPVLLHILSLPSSLLPTETIVDLGHYRREFSEIFSALRAFTANGNESAAAALSQAQTALWASVGILIAGLVLGVAAVLLERFLRRPRKKFVPKHAAGRV